MTSVPGVLAVVVSQVPGGWRRAVSLSEVMDVPEPLARAAGPLLPALTVAVFDLATIADAELESVRMRALARAALMLMKHVRRPDFVAWVSEKQSLFREVAGEGGGEAVTLLMSYARKARLDVGKQAARKIAEAAFGEAGWELIRSAEEQVLAEARAEARADMLLAQLVQRFGAVPDGVVRRVRSATAAQLDRWALRILEAATPDAVVAPDDA